MPRLILLLTIAMLCLIRTVSHSDEPHRRALLVAVNGYKHGTAHDAANLSTSRDVAALKEVLVANCGFKADDVKIIETAEATKRQSILDSFRKILIDPTQPGDVVYFHFSGHGRTVEDLKRDTHVDQTLMTSDYNADDAKNDIRGRDFTALLTELQWPKHNPASITLSFDSCYSGTMTRGPTLSRGYGNGTPPPVPVGDPAKQAGGVFESGQAARGGYIVISACRADQVAPEVRDDSGKFMGPLSYALSIALGEATDTTTYKQVMERVCSITRANARYQDPQIEGNWDKIVFNGKLGEGVHTLTVDLDTDTRQPVLLAGFPMGVTKESKYSLFKKGADQKTDPPIATAVVNSVDATHADLTCLLIDNVSLPDLRGATAVLTERSYTPLMVKVDLSSIKDHPKFKEIRAELEDLSLNTDMKAAAKGYEANYDLRLLTASAAALQGPAIKAAIGSAAAPDSLVVQREDGALLPITVLNSTVHALANDALLSTGVRSAVNQYVCWRTVNDLHNPDADEIPTVEVKYVPCDVDDKRERIVRELEPNYNTGHQLQVKVGSHFYVMVRNTGMKGAYVTVLDVQSDGVVNAMWPLATVKTSNFVNNDGEWHTTLLYDDDHTPKYWDVAPPLGPESVKIIVTIEPYDFSFLADASRGKGRGPQNPLEKLIDRAVTGRGRGFGPPQHGWNVFGFSYTIVDK